MSAISDIVAEIEQNKTEMAAAAEKINEKPGVHDAFQMGGRLYVQLHEHNDSLIPAIEDHFGVEANKVTPPGKKPTPDQAPVEKKEVEFINN